MGSKHQTMPVGLARRQKDADAGAAKHRQRLSPAALAVLVVEWVPEMEGAGEDEGLPAAVADELRGPAHAAFDEALEAVFTAGAEVLGPLPALPAPPLTAEMHCLSAAECHHLHMHWLQHNNIVLWALPLIRQVDACKACREGSL